MYISNYSHIFNRRLHVPCHYNVIGALAHPTNEEARQDVLMAKVKFLMPYTA